MRNGAIHTGLIALAIGAAAPAAAEAQEAAQREMFELPAIQVTAFQNPLHSRAIELYEQPERWEEAGEMHERAAKMLPKNAADSYYGFRQASVLYFHSGDDARSRKLMERAANVAEATGDVLTAAHTWVDAAFLAVAEGYAGKKREFVRNAKALADSELLTEVDRAAILHRIDGTPLIPETARVAMAQRLAAPLNLTVGD